MSKKFPVIFNAAKGDSPAEILVHGPIGKSFWDDDGITGKDFTDALNQVPKGSKVVIGINSQGGAVGEGLAIYNAIERRAADVTARIDGYALSIASFFPLAASKVISPKSSIWMIHNAWSWSAGNAEQLRKDAELLDTHDNTLVAGYKKKTNKPEDKIRADMSEETWLTGEEAIAYGLADEESDNAVALAALDFSAVDSKTFKKIPSNCPQILAAVRGEQSIPSTASSPAAAPISAAQQGAATPPNKQQDHTMNKALIVALLTKHGIEASETETEDQLKAKLDQIPAKDPADDSSAKILAKLQADLAKQQRYAVALEIDRLILDNKVTTAERDAEIALCLADEKRLTDVLAKRSPTLPGTAPFAAHPYAGNEGAYDHVMKLGSARKRYAHLQENWDQLKAAGFRRPGSQLHRQGPQAANTTDADLVTQMLLDGATTVLQNRLAPLRAFAKEFAPDPIKPLAILQHRKVTAGGTAQTNATNFEDTTNFVGTETNVAITMAQITAGGHVTNAERQNGVTMAQWVEKKTAEIGDAVMAAVAAVILEGTFTITPVVSSALSFGSAELASLWGKLKKSPIHNIILDGEYYAQFLPTDRFDFDVTEYRNRGWDNFLLNTQWTGATANTVGFACNPQAIVVGIGSPLRSVRADAVSSQTKLTLPGLGVTVDVNEWYSNITRNDWTTYDVMFGAAANDVTAGVLIKSA